MSQYSSPKIWGPHFWFMLRCVANNYPNNPSGEEATHIKTFFNNLQNLLPCEVCRYTYRQHLNKNPIEKSVGSKTELINWVEHIYKETRRVINDGRVKIMDIYEEEEDEIRPIKKVYKTTKQDLVNNTTRTILNKQIILPTPPTEISIPVPKNAASKENKERKILKQRKQKTVHLLNDPKETDFDIVNTGRKIDVEAIKNQRNVVVVNQKQRKQPTIFIDEPKAQKLDIQSEPAPMSLPLPKPIQQNNAIPSSLKLPIPKNKESITIQKTDKSKLEKIKYINPTYVAPIINNRNKNVNVYQKELIITKKCKKCEGGY